METVGGHGVASGAGDAVDQALETQPTQVVAHSSRGIRGLIEAQQAGNERAELAVAEASRQMGEVAQALEERHHPGIPEAQGRSADTSFEGRTLEAIEPVLGEDAVLADVFQLEELAVDLLPGGSKKGQVNNPFAGVEVAGIVDGGLRPQSALRTSLKYCLTWECLCSTCRLGFTPSVITRVR